MDELANTLANEPPVQGVRTGRRGRPKGLPRPLGSGRTLGVPNRITRDIRATAAKHSTKAIATLVKLLADKDPKVQAIAAREILDRAHGKPMSPQEITGKDGEPLHPAPDMSNTEIARRLIFSAALDLRKQGYSLGKDGTITPSGKSASPQPATDRRAEIEAAQAAMAKQAAAEPGPIAEEEEAARQAREAERYYATRHEEQGLTDNSTFNVIRMRPKHA